MTHYLGTTDNNALVLRTNATQRMRINANQTYTIGSFSGQGKFGAVGLSPNNTLWANGPGPFSRLHLHDGSTSVLSASYRSWMDNGITFTTNSDQMYVGHRVEAGSDQTSAVIQWGDNEGVGAGPDVMKFLFTADYTNGAGPNSMGGREIARMHPSGFLGVGDWQAVGLQPDERVDLLDRTIRLRSFVHPTLYRNDTYDRFLVANPADGRVYWRPMPALPSGGCEWTLQGPAGSNSHISTAYSGNTGCPQMDKGVGIGTSTPGAKLDVFHNTFTTLGRTAIHGYLEVPPGSTAGYGLLGDAWNPAQAYLGVLVGVQGQTGNSRSATGVMGISLSSTSSLSGNESIGVWGRGMAFGSTTPVAVVGLRGQAMLSGAAHANNLQGVHGTASMMDAASGASFISAITGLLQVPDPNNPPPNAWAGYFYGDVHATGTISWASDASLKTGIEPVQDAAVLLSALQPKRYTFRTEEFPFMNLPTGQHLGLVAQEVQEILPDLIKPATMPAEYDSMGQVVHPEVDYLTLNYAELIPLLVAGFQQHQQQVEQQQATIAQMQAQLAACCAANPGMAPGGNGGLKAAPATGEVKEQHLLIIPNPVADLTKLEYYVPQAGKVSLSISTGDGKPMGTLREEQAEVGAYTYQWNTTKLAVGTYFCTYLLDGTVVVKRAVKVQ